MTMFCPTYTLWNSVLPAVGIGIALLGIVLIALSFMKQRYKIKLAWAGTFVLLFGIGMLAFVAAYPSSMCAVVGGEAVGGLCPGEWRCEQPDSLAGAACDSGNYTVCKYDCICSHGDVTGMCSRHSLGGGCYYAIDSGGCRVAGPCI